MLFRKLFRPTLNKICVFYISKEKGQTILRQVQILFASISKFPVKSTVSKIFALWWLLRWCSCGHDGFFAEQPKCQKEIHIFFCVAPMHCGDYTYTFRVLGTEKVLYMGANCNLNCTSSDVMAPLLVLLRSRWFFRRVTKMPKRNPHLLLRGTNALWRLYIHF